MLHRFKMDGCETAPTPYYPGVKLSSHSCPANEDERREIETRPYRALTGMLLWVSTCTRPDIAYSVGRLGQFVNNPDPQRWEIQKHVLKYLQGTLNNGLDYTHPMDRANYCHTDSDWASDTDNRPSTSGYISLFSNRAISWRSKL